MRVTVQCVSGYKADERPVAFRIGARELRVERIIDRWYEPEYSYFKVRADDGHLYILKQHAAGPWELISFKKAGPGESPQ
jgi:hypothetical protein